MDVCHDNVFEGLRAFVYVNNINGYSRNYYREMVLCTKVNISPEHTIPATQSYITSACRPEKYFFKIVYEILRKCFLGTGKSVCVLYTNDSMDLVITVTRMKRGNHRESQV